MNTIARNDVGNAVDAAYDRYLDRLDALAKAAGIQDPSPRIVESDARTREDAAKALVEFNDIQDDLNQAFADFKLAKHGARAAEASNARHVHNAQASVDAAQFWVKQEQAYIDQINAGDFTSAGLTEPTQADLDKLEKMSANLGLEQDRLHNIQSDLTDPTTADQIRAKALTAFQEAAERPIN